MKMVKSLLLGTAAGLVAIAGAQAADLPVKAKPVQYVKICSLYGAGFYYIPGTDMCLKVGGWVREEIAWHANGSLTNGAFANAVNSRATNNFTMRSRGYITADARNQSEYGTIRSYIAVGLSGNDNANTSGTASVEEPVFSSNRAFIQFAGFTFGLAQSFFDFYSVPATSYWGAFGASDTGDPGWKVASYTAQFGNGLSGTIGIEAARRTQIINTDNSDLTLLTTTGANGTLVLGQGLAGGAISSALTGVASGGQGAYAGAQVPDVVGNLRIDQAWGSAQIMAAWHLVDATYYSTQAGTPFVGVAATTPADKSGYALGAGIKINAPAIGTGDYFQAQVNYAVGASRYVFQTPNFNHGMRNGNTQAWGILSDAVYGGNIPQATGTDLNLTTAWGINAAYEHFWNPKWRTSLYGGIDAVRYNAQANAMLCTIEPANGIANFNAQAGLGNGNAAVAFPGCNNNWSSWWLGSRTQWNITPDTYLGLDVMYQKLHSATNGLFFSPYLTTTLPSTNGDVDNWALRFRVHRDFYP